MLRPLVCLSILFPLGAFACGASKTVVDVKPAGPPQYICFDGRTLTCARTGYIWQAKRGCFFSHVPCEDYQANFYGYYPRGNQIARAYYKCRKGYPWRLGEMQTH